MDVIAERTLDYQGNPVTVRVGRPERRPSGEWGCAVELVGLPEPRGFEAYGSDSAQALMHALDAVGAEVRRHNLTAAVGHPWPVRLEPIEVVEKPKLAPLPPQVVAEVEVERFADEEGEAAKGKVTLLAPVPVSDSEWQCEYRITGIRKEETCRPVSSGDSFGALLGAIFLIPTEFWHEPVIVHDGWPARDYLRLHSIEHVPMPLLMERLRRYGAKTAWLVDLDAGIQALRQLYRWTEVTKETAEVIKGVEALERSLRYLQMAKGQVDFPPVEEWDISRVVEIRKALDAGLVTAVPDLQKLVFDAIISWHHMVHKIRGDE